MKARFSSFFFSSLDFVKPPILWFVVCLWICVANGYFSPGKKQWWSYVKLLINWAALLPCD